MKVGKVFGLGPKMQSSNLLPLSLGSLCLFILLWDSTDAPHPLHVKVMKTDDDERIPNRNLFLKFNTTLLSLGRAME